MGAAVTYISSHVKFENTQANTARRTEAAKSRFSGFKVLPLQKFGFLKIFDLSRFEAARGIWCKNGWPYRVFEQILT